MIRRATSATHHDYGALSVKTAFLDTDPMVTVARVLSVRLRLRMAKFARDSVTVTVTLPPVERVKASEPKLSFRRPAAAIAFLVANETRPRDLAGVPFRDRKSVV